MATRNAQDAANKRAASSIKNTTVCRSFPYPLVGDFSMYLSEARPLVEAELRDIDAEERSDVSVRSLNERSLLG